MIIVRFELHSAITHEVRELARMEITNVGGTDTIGDYDVRTFRGRSAKELDRRVINRVGKVLGHARLKEHVWVLVAKALKALSY